MNNLGNSFLTRFERLGQLNDLEDAISRQRDAVNLAPNYHPEKPGYLNNLGNSFRVSFKRLRRPNDLEDAISRQRDAINLTPNDHPYKPSYLNNLGHSFLARFEHSGQPNDLEDAISRQRDAVSLTPDGYPQKPSHLISLGDSFVTRFERLGRRPSDMEHAISLYLRAASDLFGLPGVRFRASQRWISCARRTHHHSLLHAHSVVVSLLPQLAWNGLPLSDRYSEPARSADVVREAAAAALESGFPETAVEWLEQGRSIVWGDLLQLRSVFKELFSAHPSHARRLEELSAALDHASATHEKSMSAPSEETGTVRASLREEADRHRKLAIERDELLQEIRRLPGFERFLLQKQFSQLRASAHSGPVVMLNAAESRCDALIILADVDHVIHVPLPDFTLKRSVGLQNILNGFIRHARDGLRPRPFPHVSWKDILSQLWKYVVKPVLDSLALSVRKVELLTFTADLFTDQIPGDFSRIFWCPTGPFMFLPIHAAGLHEAIGRARGRGVPFSHWVPFIHLGL